MQSWDDGLNGGEKWKSRKASRHRRVGECVEEGFRTKLNLTSGWDDLFKPASQLGCRNKKCLPKDAGGLDGATVDTANPSP